MALSLNQSHIGKVLVYKDEHENEMHVEILEVISKTNLKGKVIKVNREAEGNWTIGEESSGWWTTSSGWNITLEEDIHDNILLLLIQLSLLEHKLKHPGILPESFAC